MWRGPRGALLAGVGALVAACGSAPAATFHPGGANPAGAGGVAGPSSSRLAQTASQQGDVAPVRQQRPRRHACLASR